MNCFYKMKQVQDLSSHNDNVSNHQRFLTVKISDRKFIWQFLNELNSKLYYNLRQR